MRGVLALVAFALAVPGGGTSWRTYRDATDACTVAVPSGWQVVPQSTADVKARAAQANAHHDVSLAAEWGVIAAERKTEPRFGFQAFQWPAPEGPIDPDVTVKVDPVTPATTAKNLPAIAKAYAQSLAKTKGVRVAAPVAVKLAAGPSVRLDGSVPLGKGGRTGFTVYLLLRPKRLYSLSFRYAPSHAEADLFAQIADRFAFM